MLGRHIANGYLQEVSATLLLRAAGDVMHKAQEGNRYSLHSETGIGWRNGRYGAGSLVVYLPMSGL